MCHDSLRLRDQCEGSTVVVYSQGDIVTVPVCQGHSQTVVRLKKSHFYWFMVFLSALFTKETLEKFSQNVLSK